MRKRSLGILKVFIATGCWGCKRALELVDWIKAVKPYLSVEVVDLALQPNAGAGLVFAVPSYVYNSTPVFLGNPSEKELQTWLDGLGETKE